MLVGNAGAKHGYIEPFLDGASSSIFITSVRMTGNTRGRIVPQNTLKSAVRLWCAVGNNNDTCVLRIAHANATTMMDRHPGGSTGSI
jgi:hypothetical protein